jgi:hypothetical protein
VDGACPEVTETEWTEFTETEWTEFTETEWAEFTETEFDGGNGEDPTRRNGV